MRVTVAFVIAIAGITAAYPMADVPGAGSEVRQPDTVKREAEPVLVTFPGKPGSQLRGSGKREAEPAPVHWPGGEMAPNKPGTASKREAEAEAAKQRPSSQSDRNPGGNGKREAAPEAEAIYVPNGGFDFDLPSGSGTGRLRTGTTEKRDAAISLPTGPLGPGRPGPAFRLPGGKREAAPEAEALRIPPGGRPPYKRDAAPEAEAARIPPEGRPPYKRDAAPEADALRVDGSGAGMPGGRRTGKREAAPESASPYTSTSSGIPADEYTGGGPTKREAGRISNSPGGAGKRDAAVIMNNRYDGIDSIGSTMQLAPSKREAGITQHTPYDSVGRSRILPRKREAGLLTPFSRGDQNPAAANSGSPLRGSGE